MLIRPLKKLLAMVIKNQKKPQNNYPVQKVFILGIGNPDEKYKNTRHNVGKDWVEKIASDYGQSFVKKLKLKCNMCEVEPNIFLVTPDVYVNETGKVASLLKRYLNAKPEQILVIHDDIDTQIGEARFKSGGGDGAAVGIVRKGLLVLGRPRNSLHGQYVQQPHQPDLGRRVQAMPTDVRVARGID